MVETSPFLRKIQMKKLCSTSGDEELELGKPHKFKDSLSIHITWLEDISQLPKKDVVHFVLANEFFDALPIQKFEVRKIISELTSILQGLLKNILNISRKQQMDIEKFWWVLIARQMN